jgi:guanylate kinase
LVKSNPQIIVLSGPSGVGKDTIIQKLKVLSHHRHFVITATTRQPREGEEHGKHYHFLSESEFQKMLQDGEFIECARVYDNWYGVPKEEVRCGLTEGEDVIIKVDIQGAATIKKLVPQAILIFITSPSHDELIRRLSERGTESDRELNVRIEKAKEELENLAIFDYVVVNHKNQIDATVAEINALIEKEKNIRCSEIIL